MRLVVIESPFAGEVERNKAYLKRCVWDCLKRNESPYASHGFFTQFLDDNIPEERDLGIMAGLQWSRIADVVFYIDYGMSEGMKKALIWHAETAAKNSWVKTIEFRHIGTNEAPI